MSMSSKIYIAYIEVRQVSAIDSRASHSAYFRGLLSPVADLIGESPRPPPPHQTSKAFSPQELGKG